MHVAKRVVGCHMHVCSLQSVDT